MRIRRRAGLPKMYFHAMNRGARKLSIFTDDESRRYFLALLALYSKKYGVGIIAWCLMPNHYHLLLSSEGTPLFQMMREMEKTYARYFNRRYSLSGALFQSRFVTTAPDTESAIAWISRYIHANPVSLGVQPEEYVWSSCRSYLGLDPKPVWLNPHPVFRIIRTQGKADSQTYREYLEATPSKKKQVNREFDSLDEFFLEFITHLEGQYAEKMVPINRGSHPPELRTVVTWAAVRHHRIPAKVLMEYYGYDSIGCVYRVVHRFEVSLSKRIELRALIQPDTFLIAS